MKIYIAKNRVRHGPYGLSELNAKVARGDFVATDSACFDGKKLGFNFGCTWYRHSNGSDSDAGK